MSPGVAGPSRTNCSERQAAEIFSSQPHNSWGMGVLVRRAGKQGTWAASATPGKRRRSQSDSGAVLPTSPCTASYKVKRKMKNRDICGRQRVTTKHLVVKELLQCNNPKEKKAAIQQRDKSQRPPLSSGSSRNHDEPTNELQLY